MNRLDVQEGVCNSIISANSGTDKYLYICVSEKLITVCTEEQAVASVKHMEGVTPKAPGSELADTHAPRNFWGISSHTVSRFS